MQFLLALAFASVEGQRARIDVDGEVNAKQAKQVEALVEAVVADVERRFTQPAKKPDAHVKLLVYSDADRYQTEAAKLGPVISDWGFYMPDQRTAIANVGVSIGNLRHELVHPLIGDDYPTIPAWLNEGVASLYGSAKLGKHGFTFLVNYRLLDLQKALKAGTLPTLAQLAATTADDMHGDQAMMYYAYARYVLLYAETKGTLSKLYADLRAADPSKHASILASYVDEKAFRAWAKKLRYRR
ncbi:MAG TPA: hypothetical protein VL326_11230 [Kofleriaceae bacterium]|nr:hypothetical protein [Kofleriaceae bacterium]